MALDHPGQVQPKRAASSGLPPATTTSTPPRVTVTISDSSAEREPPVGDQCLKPRERRRSGRGAGGLQSGMGVIVSEPLAWKPISDAALGPSGRQRGAAASIGGRDHHRAERGGSPLPGQCGPDDLLFPLEQRTGRTRAAAGNRHSCGHGGKGGFTRSVDGVTIRISVRRSPD